MAGDDAVISENLVFDNANGISVGGGARTLVRGNTVFGNSGGIQFSSTGGTVRDNSVFDNQWTGISAGQDTFITANQVYRNQTGISGGQSAENVVWANQIGISGGYPHHNRVFGNDVGINNANPVRNNEVYSNRIGIQLAGSSGGSVSGEISNNLIYANREAAIRLSIVSSVQLVNNTIHQPAGDGVRAESSAYGTVSGLTLRNNVIWTEQGYGLSIPPDCQTGFQSDYNLLRTTGSGKLGRWQNHDFTSLSDWFYELGFDAHSLSVDPQFIDSDGPDGLLGVSDAGLEPPQIIDNGDAGFSLAGTWSAESTSGYLGDYHRSDAGSGADVATWTFTGLVPGGTIRWP